MTAPRLLIATHSAHKLRELRELLALEETELVSFDDLGIEVEPVEDGETFETNAAIKARFGVRASGLPTLADDSGIEVDALGEDRVSGPAATPARTPRMPTTTQSCSRPWATFRPSDAARATCASSRWHSPTTRDRAAAWRSSPHAGRAAAGSPRKRVAAAGSATTRSSSRDPNRRGAARSVSGRRTRNMRSRTAPGLPGG